MQDTGSPASGVCKNRFYFLKNGVGYRYGGIETVEESAIEEVYGISAQVMEVDGRKFVMIG